MKKLIAFTLTIVALTFSSCKDDETVVYYNGTGTITETNENLGLISDNDNKILGVQTSYTKELKVGDKVYFYCSEIRKGDTNEPFNYLVNYLEVLKLPTKDIQIIDEVSRDTIGNDWIKINQSWIKNQYLTIDFTYGAYDQKHYINVVFDSLNQTKQDTVILELKHQANGDETYYAAQALFCFDLSSMEWNGETPHHIILKNKKFDGSENETKFDYSPVVIE